MTLPHVAHWSHPLSHDATCIVLHRHWHLSLIGGLFPLYLVHLARGSASFATGPSQVTEQICMAGSRFTGTPFQCGSGSVATVVLWNRYACELCDAPVQPTRCPLPDLRPKPQYFCPCRLMLRELSNFADPERTARSSHIQPGQLERRQGSVLGSVTYHTRHSF